MDTADGATSAEQHVVPMSDSLLERAKVVVDTRFVDDAFAVSSRPWRRWPFCAEQGGDDRRRGLPPKPGPVAGSGNKLADPCQAPHQCRLLAC